MTTVSGFTPYKLPWLPENSPAATIQGCNNPATTMQLKN
jgi:hypothetical protein